MYHLEIILTIFGAFSADFCWNFATRSMYAILSNDDQAES